MITCTTLSQHITLLIIPNIVSTFRTKYEFEDFKSVLNLQMTYIIIAHIYEQWDR